MEQQRLALLARGATLITLDRQRLLFFDKAATFLVYERYGFAFAKALYQPLPAKKKGDNPEIKLVSADALAFFLWAALQADVKAEEQELTLEQAGDFITPYNLEPIFYRVFLALTRATATPSLPGKTAAVAASPAAPAPKAPGPTKVSTSLTRSASPTRSSGKRRKNSGRQR